MDRPTLVLGSTQDASIVDRARLQAAGVRLVRRRSGGGAVLLGPRSQVWVDIWLPKGDVWWSAEPRRSAELVGQWWAASLPRGLVGPLTVHRGPSVPGPRPDRVCFGGVGAGEVLVAARKLVGLAQWRSREGALVHGCAYRVWDPAAIADLLVAGTGPGCPGAGARAQLVAALAGRAVGLEEVRAPGWTADSLLRALPDEGSWEIVDA